mgnify:CR=1 FL=1
MGNTRNTVEKLTNWLNKGNGTDLFLKRVLLIAAAFLVLYRLGYAMGKLLFRFGM